MMLVKDLRYGTNDASKQRIYYEILQKLIPNLIDDPTAQAGITKTNLKDLSFKLESKEVKKLRYAD